MNDHVRGRTHAAQDHAVTPRRPPHKPSRQAAPGYGAAADFLLFLQRTAGNAAVNQMLQTPMPMRPSAAQSSMPVQRDDDDEAQTPPQAAAGSDSPLVGWPPRFPDAGTQSPGNADTNAPLGIGATVDENGTLQVPDSLIIGDPNDTGAVQLPETLITDSGDDSMPSDLDHKRADAYMAGSQAGQSVRTEPDGSFPRSQATPPPQWSDVQDSWTDGFKDGFAQSHESASQGPMAGNNPAPTEEDHEREREAAEQRAEFLHELGQEIPESEKEEYESRWHEPYPAPTLPVPEEEEAE